MSRRLPVFFLIDNSESMAGATMKAVSDGLHHLLEALRSDPRSLETTHVSMITFGGKARTLMTLTPVDEIRIPKFGIGCGTSLGGALDLLLHALRSDLRANGADGQKGDWRPLCFLLSDGDPTDAWRDAALKVRAMHDAGRCLMVAVACGPDVDVDNLRVLTPVVHTSDTDADSIAHYFRWVTRSMQVASVAVGVTTDLPAFHGKPDSANPTSESNRKPGLFLITRCQKFKGPCVMKYRWRDGLYQATESVAIDELDCGTSAGQETNTSRLGPSRPCPRCEADGWAQCGACKRLFCHQTGVRECICPWCSVAGITEVRDFGITGSGG